MSDASATLKEVFSRALDCASAAERDRYLTEACAGNAALRAEVEALLRAHANAGSFLEQPVQRDMFAETVGPGTEPCTAEFRLERLGDYRIVREVGRGGMGVVYEAEQESLGRHVALKVLPASAMLDARQLQRFRREARAAARLHHTNIVPVYGVGEQDGLHYYVMQFIEGQALDQVLTAVQRLRQAIGLDGTASQPGGAAVDVAASLLNGSFGLGEPGIPPAGLARAAKEDGNLSSSTSHPPGQAEGAPLSGSGRAYWRSVARLGMQVAEALAYAASQGILHRDIEPANLLLDAAGIVWITDFGLAKADTDHDNVTQTGDIVGTLRYMAPERFQRKGDVRSDVYALGLTLYEMLALRPAYPEVHRTKLIAQVLREDPPPLRKLDPAVPRDLETIVSKAIAREPAQRYQTPAELADDLRRFLDDRPIKARRLGLMQRGWRWCRRNPLVATLGSTITTLVLVIAIGSPIMLLRLQGELQRAEKAEKDAEDAAKDATDRLWGSYLAQAQARRWSGHAGRHFKSLEVLQAAAAIRSSLELRNEAIACTPLVDLRIARQWPHLSGRRVCFDPSLERYSVVNQGSITIHRVGDDRELARLAAADVTGWAWFSPDGRYLCFGTKNDRLCQLWALDPVGKVVEAPFHGDVRIRPDSRRLAASTGTGTIRFYDLPSGQAVNELTLGKAIIRYCYHPSGHLLAVLDERTSGDSAVQLIDANDGKLLQELKHPAGVSAVAWHPDGRLLAVASQRKICIWDTDTGKQRAVLEGHQNQVRSCSFSHGGDLLASNAWDGTTRLWDPFSGKELVSTACYFSDFRADDRYLAFTTGGGVGLWEVATGRECRTLYAPPADDTGPWTVDLHPNGRLAATSHDDGVRLWDLVAGKVVAQLPAGNSRTALFGGAGDELITCGASGLYRWSVLSDPQGGGLRVGPAQALHTPWPRSEPYGGLSRNRRWLAVPAERSNVLVFDLENAAKAVRLAGHDLVNWLAVSPDGRWVATATQHGSGIKIWDAGSAQVVKEVTAGGYGWAAFSPDGKWLATGSHGHDTCLWEVKTWEVRHCWSRFGSMAFAGGTFSPDSKLLAIKHSRTLIDLIDPATGHELATLPAPNPLPISGLCFTPDGNKLVAGCYNYRALQVWDLCAIRARLKVMNLDWD